MSSGLEHLETFGDAINEMASAAEELSEQREDVANRIDAIERALSQLGDDQQVAQSIEQNNLSDALSELEDIRVRREEIVSEVESTLETLDELEQENDQSAEAVQELAEVGEDASGSEAIVEERRAQIEQHKARAQEVLRRLR